MKNKPDWILILLFILLTVCGWISIFSTEYLYGDFVIKSSYGMQLIWIVSMYLIGLFVLVIHKRFYYNVAAYLYLAFNLLILVAFFIGIERSGAKSWLGIGGFGIQPAEFAKYGTCLLLSRFLSLRSCNLTQTKSILIAAIIICIPACLILLQNDTGSAIPFLFLIFALFREGLPPWILIVGFAAVLLFVLLIYFSQWMIIIALSVLFLLVFILFFRKKKQNLLTILIIYILAIGYVFVVDMVYRNVLREHQRKRIELVFGKIDDPKGIGYNVNQSMIAIGSGGLTGKGFGESTQTRLNFVPEQSTDFIFCTIGEEHGFFGSLFVILLYIFFIWRIIALSEKCGDTFNRCYGYCIASIFFAHIMINIGMTIGLMPVIGIPLPFISYGGSSLWAFGLMLFTFLNMSKNRSIINIYRTKETG
ncbi:MAG: rod shape-determining protein RodA [Bacteroidales bacterium]|jgi:rod shape determining protein RodA|nr:rod shape-determining protein RodA [Bacteroidales bacterium]